ncbi:MAG: hypothetical protein BMS9Abin11_1284 [Gammaproteobacteria bacterium]|nr:MAG: hypothetical protein BMS9Abin11_1284 [Gammaproteobacteria bacterium]
MSNKRPPRRKRPTPEKQTQAHGEKLQKVLARAGLGSRRQMEQWIEAGRVSVDGSVVTIGTRVDPQQVIRVDGHILSSTATKFTRRVLLYHKPEGEVCTRRDPEGRPTIFTRLPRISKGRWIGIGRLDINTSGLMLLTTDGELANRLMHPRYRLLREYAVRVRGQASQNTLEKLKQGVELSDGLAAFDDIVAGGGEGSNQWYTVSLREGRNREIRRMWEAVGLTVSRLIRVRFGPIVLPRRVRQGHWQELEDDEVRALVDTVSLGHVASSHKVKPSRR